MARTYQSTKMYQSRAIMRIGCFGAVLVLILLCLIGANVIRADLGSKRADAMAGLGRMHEQIEKAPGILQRTLAYDCGSEAEDAVDALVEAVTGLSETAPLGEQEAVWSQVEETWVAVSMGCRSSLGEAGFIDLTTEMEGVRNRYSVEKGKYGDAAEVYNEALAAFLANLVGWGFEPL